jgi:ABC-type glycerol-3-phosphate transport system substrate-binding protein
MKALLGVLLVGCALAAAGAASAQITTAPTYVFTTIDSLARRSPSELILAGVQDGAAGPSEVRIDSYTSSVGPEGLDSCERSAATMMAKPGQYRLDVWITNYAFCRLRKANP